MPNTKLSDILSNGKTELSPIKEIDFNSPKIRKRIARLKIEIEKSRRRKNVDWNKLSQWEIPWNGPRGPR